MTGDPVIKILDAGSALEKKIGTPAVIVVTLLVITLFFKLIGKLFKF